MPISSSSFQIYLLLSVVVAVVVNFDGAFKSTRNTHVCFSYKINTGNVYNSFFFVCFFFALLLKSSINSFFVFVGFFFVICYSSTRKATLHEHVVLNIARALAATSPVSNERVWLFFCVCRRLVLPLVYIDR